MEAMPPLLPHRDDWKAAEICIETCDFRCGCRHMASTRRVAELLTLSGRYPLYLPLTCCRHTHIYSNTEKSAQSASFVAPAVNMLGPQSQHENENNKRRSCTSCMPLPLVLLYSPFVLSSASFNYSFIEAIISLAARSNCGFLAQQRQFVDCSSRLLNWLWISEMHRLKIKARHRTISG